MRSTQTLLYSEIAVNLRPRRGILPIYLKEDAEVGRNEVFHVEFELNLEAGTLFYLSLAVEADCTLMLLSHYITIIASESFCKVVAFVWFVSMFQNGNRAD